jgi:excisionase family DNA binding protein
MRITLHTKLVFVRHNQGCNDSSAFLSVLKSRILMEHLLHTPALAERLGVSRRTIEDWRLHGTGPRFVRVGRRVAYREADVAAWLEANASAGTPAA